MYVRSPITLATGVVSTAGVECPEGYSPAFDPYNPDVRLDKCVRSAPRTETSFSESFGDWLIDTVPAFIATGGTSIIGTVAGQLATAALVEADVDYAKQIGAGIGLAAGAASADFTWAPDITDIYGEAQPMFEDFSFDWFDDFSISDFLPSSETFSAITSIAAPVASALLAPQPVSRPMMPMTTTQGGAFPVSAGAVPITAMGTAVARWAMQYPNLWQAIQKLAANFRAKVTPEKLWTMLKQFGPTYLAGIIGAAAVQELVLYKSTRKRRRMNVANTRALRRSLRRLKGFNRLSHRVAAQLGRAGARRSKARCTTCRRNPCSC